MKPIKLSRRLSFRLALILTGTLFLSCIGVGTVVYYSLTDTIKRTELSAIEHHSLEYKYAFMNGGLPSLEKLHVFIQSQHHEKKIFLRVEDSLSVRFQSDYASNHLTGINFLPGWNLRLLDEGVPQSSYLKRMEFNLKSFVLVNGWTGILQFFNFEAIYVYKTKLSDDLWLSVGHSLKSSEREFLKVRIIVFELLGLFIIVALILAWTISRTVIYPIRNFLKTIQEIEAGIPTRVKLSGTNEELDLLSAEFNSLMDSNANLIKNMNSTMDTIAHEIRTPITRFRIGAELALLEKEVPGKLETAIVDGLESSERVSTLLTNILDSSRISSGLVKPSLTRFCVLELFKELEDIYQFLLEEKRMSLIFKDTESLLITADRSLLLQALNNLTDNAIKYSSESSAVRLSAIRQKDAVWITVSDTGCGIQQSELSKIFERLYRSPRSDNENGYGIGLSIVKQVVEIHGWEVKVSSQLGVGSTFTLIIPDIV